MELSTLVLYDVEDDRARTKIAEACKDFGLQRLQYSCFRGPLSRNKREELEERLLAILRDWRKRWSRDFPEAPAESTAYPGPPAREASHAWRPVFKVLIQPVCEKDVQTAIYSHVYVDLPEGDRTTANAKSQP